MSKQNAHSTTAAKTTKSKTTFGRLSTQIPTTDEIVRAMQAKKRLEEAAKIGDELKKLMPLKKDKVIILSDSW